jgi:hypothetical protein
MEPFMELSGLERLLPLTERRFFVGEKGRVAFGPETNLAGRTLNAQTLRAAQQEDAGPAAR